MKRILLMAVVALALPTAALSKGPSEASLTGPGLDGELAVPAYGEYSGLYELSLPKSPPAGELGPRYKLSWTFPFLPLPGPVADRSAEIIRQDLYPYAQPAPVTYTPPGQPLWGKEHEGGWYVSSPKFRELLVGAGLPAEPPAGGRLVWPWLTLALALGLAACFWLARSISTTRTPSASSASTSSTRTTGPRSSTADPRPASPH